MFACADCDLCRTFIWQNDKTRMKSRRVPLGSLEKQNWIHDSETEKWITQIESAMLSICEQIRRNTDPIVLKMRVRKGENPPADLRIPIYMYIASIPARRGAKQSFQEAITRWKTEKFVDDMAFRKCLMDPRLSWDQAKAVTRTIVAGLTEDEEKLRGMMERDVIDGEDCPFGELLLLRTMGEVVLPDIG